VGLLGINVWGMLNIRQNFDPRKYITWGSYQDLYLKAIEQYFPEHGENSAFYISKSCPSRQFFILQTSLVS
jgi:hypothetical protein